MPTVRRAAGYRFSVEIADEMLDRWVDELFAGFPIEVADDAARWKVRLLERESDDDGAARWDFTVDGAFRGSAEHPEELVTSMVQTLNGDIVTSWPGVVCHAGGVSSRGRGILLPADPESGKTTLTAGLVRAGFAYLSDEGVAFHPGTNLIEPYPKPLSIDRGSWFLFPELEPRAAFATDEYKRSQWQVAPSAIRPDAVGGPCPAHFVVFPKYVDGAATELVPIGRAEALLELAKNTFGFNSRSRLALEELTPVVRACDCFRLTVGTLDEAVACIEELVADA